MSYNKTVWHTGDIVHADLLNNIEDGISKADNKLEGIEEGALVNKIEGIQFNGSDLTLDTETKKVNILAAPYNQAVPLPQLEDEGKILGYEALTEGAAPVVGWVKKPVDGTTPHIDQTTKEWMIGEEHTGVDAEGKDAYQVAVSQGYEGTKSEWLASLKGDKGDNAVNPFKGIYGSNNKPTGTFTIGDYLYAPTSESEGTGNTIWKWNGTTWQDSGETPDMANAETFASSETLQQVAIDDSHLVNPVNTADSTQPVLSRAEDVMQLKAKLEGVTASKTKAIIGEQISGYINGDGVPTAVSSTTTYVVIALNNAKSVRLLGSTNPNSGTNYASYAFWNSATYVDSSTVVEAHNWDVREGSTNYAKEYTLDVPNGATHIAVTLTTTTNQSNFYCYLQSGESVVDMMTREVKEVDDKIEGTVTYEETSLEVTENAYGAYKKDTTDNCGLGEKVTMHKITNIPGYSDLARFRVVLYPGDKVEFKNKRTNASTGRSVFITRDVYNSNTDTTDTRLIAYIKAANYNTAARGVSVIEYTRDGLIVISDENNYSKSALYFNKDCDNTYIPSRYVNIYINFVEYDSAEDYATKYKVTIENSIREDVKQLEDRVSATESAVESIGIFKEINPLNYIRSGYIGLTSEKWFTTGNYERHRFAAIPVQEGTVKFRINYLTHYAFLSECPNPVNGETVETLIGNVVSISPDSGESIKEITVEVPSNAKYLYVLLGTNNTYHGAYWLSDTNKSNRNYNNCPLYIGYSGKIFYPSREEEYNKKKEQHKAEFISNGYKCNLHTLATPYELPNVVYNGSTPTGTQDKVYSLEILNAIKKAYQQTKLSWTPKHDIPHRRKSGATGDNGSYEANVEFTNGIPYSSNLQDYKHIGVEVSLETFMTAVNNPFSVLYTEDVSKYHSVSIWGRKYLNPNAGAYYGSVCCGFTSSVYNQDTKIHNIAFKPYLRMYGQFITISPECEMIDQLVQVGDVADSNGHSFIITGIVRNNSGAITHIRYHECTSGNWGCREQVQTAAYFRKVLNDTADNTDKYKNPYTIYRHIDAWKNYNYEQSEFVTLSEFGETPLESYEYNNEICTIYGDKPCLIEGQVMALNYNLNYDQDFDYTHIRLQKYNTTTNEWNSTILENDEWIPAEQCLSLANADASIPEAAFQSQQGHCYYLGNNLPAGIYRACMSKRINDEYSDSDKYTYFEILTNDVIVEEHQDGLYRVYFGAKGKEHAYLRNSYIPRTQMVWFYIGTPFKKSNDEDATEDEKNTLQTTYCGRPLTKTEYDENVIQEYMYEYLSDFGYGYGINRHVRVGLKGKFGIAYTTAKKIPNDIMDILEGNVNQDIVDPDED